MEEQEKLIFVTYSDKTKLMAQEDLATYNDSLEQLNKDYLDGKIDSTYVQDTLLGWIIKGVITGYSIAF